MEVYLVTNTVNGKQYIGQTTQPVAIRWTQHVRESRRLHLPLYAAIRKYGATSFILSVLGSASSQEELNQLEMGFIDAYNTLDRDFGYNLHEGGNKPPLMTPETAAKSGLSRRGRKRPQHVIDAVRRAQLGNTHKLGKEVSSETRQKIGKAHKGMKHTPESIEKIKKARANQAPIKWSAESRARFSSLVKCLGRVPPSRLGCRKAQGELS
jgi:group I intron endonuclease